MADNEYHFVDRWRVEGDVKEYADILEDALSLPRWWGSVSRPNLLAWCDC